jgi:signal transduction histidine kinase
VTLARELGATFLFESLSEKQLQGLAELGSEVSFAAGDTIFVEGQPAEFLWVLLEGEMTLERNVGGQRILLTTATRPGTYGGGIQAFAGSSVASGYRATATAKQPGRFFRLPASERGRLFGEWSPVAKHFLDGYLQRLEGIEATVRERERLISLGRMAAGLAHEINNPAAAATRATSELRTSVDQLQEGLRWIADANVPPTHLRQLLDVQTAARGTAPPPGRGALERASAEDELGGWLDEQGVNDAWTVATTLTSMGIDVDWLQSRTEGLESDELGAGLSWVAATFATSSLLDQVEHAVGRISQLVGAVKEYSGVDRAPEQEVDVHDGIEKTILVLGHKIRPGVEIVRDYDEHLPRIQANGAELNQVWTNLIDNAIDAIQGHGQVLVRSRLDGKDIVVEIEDHGPGIPAELVSRIFDPFFTTKEPGQGTGLGLDIVRRIVVERHHGDISVESEPGATRFIVRLPVD